MRDEAPAEVEGLRKVPFFQDLTTDDLERLAGIGRRRAYEAGQDIVRKGDVEGGLFFILSGSATVQTGGASHTLGPGSFFGEMALLDGGPRVATVTAATPMYLLVLSRPEFNGLILDVPKVARRMLEAVGARLRQVEQSPNSAPIGA